MRHQKVDVLRPEVQPRERVLTGTAHALHGALEDLLPLELPAGDAVEHAAVGIAPAHALHAQDLARIPVAAELLGEYAFLAIAGLEHHRRRAIAEQHRDIAVAPVHEGRDELRADHQGVAHHLRADQRGGGGQPVEKTGAGGVDVEGRRGLCADAHLDA